MVCRRLFQRFLVCNLALQFLLQIQAGALFGFGEVVFVQAYLLVQYRKLLFGGLAHHALAQGPDALLGG